MSRSDHISLLSAAKTAAIDTIMSATAPAWLAISVAAIIGLCYAVELMGAAGAVGTAPFWSLPTGLIGGALDIRNALAGYWWFVQADWHWPLLQLSKPNWPAGTNAALFDIIPIVAISGKILRSVFGWEVNPYPIWTTLCLVLNAAALTMLVRALGCRYLAGAVLAGAFGAMAPVVQFRFGHLALMAHWLPIAALAHYFYTKPARFGAHAIAVATAICVLAACVHLYLYVMTAAIMVAAALQAVLDRRLRPQGGLLAAGLVIIAGLAPQWVFGLFDNAALIGVTGDFSRYSMNLLSPFWPQTSGLFRWTGIYWLTRGVISATPGQYEGYDYLGAGALLLTLLATATNLGKIGRSAVQHPALIGALFILLLWALSNRIFLGPYLVLSYEPPTFLADTALAWFRSCGRFFWPIGWLMVGFGIARAPPLFRPKAGLAVMVLALLMQWIEAAPWREDFARLFATPPATAFGGEAVAKRLVHAIRATGTVAVLPPVFCSSGADDYSSPLNIAALEVQLMAARANARMPAVYLSRMPQRCSTRQLVGAPAIVVALKDPGATTKPIFPDEDNCFDASIARVCTLSQAP